MKENISSTWQIFCDEISSVEEHKEGIVYLCFNKVLNTSSHYILTGNLILEKWTVRWTEKYSNAGFTELPLVAQGPPGGQSLSVKPGTWALAPTGANTV